MEYILYKKNIPILKYTEDNDEIEVTKVINKEHLPVHLFCNGKASAENLYSIGQKLQNFLNNRLIPSTRKNFSEALKELEVSSNSELAKKSYYLSLSDQYWICKTEDAGKIFWEEINFFTNEYDSAIGLRLVNNSKNLNKNSSSYTPDNTTNGELPKRWFRKDGVNYLEKAGSGSEHQEPLNELLACEICRRLGISYIPYYLEIREENYFSYCPDMVDENTEMVPLDSIYQDLHLTPNNNYDYAQLISRCNEMQIPNAEEDILKIFLLDFIIANEDRHSYNISFLRNSNTLQWIGVAPVYDSGKSMYINKLSFEIEMCSSLRIPSKPFFDNQFLQFKNLPMEKIIDKIDLSKLDGIENWYRDFLSTKKRLHQDKKDALVEKLVERIEETKKLLSKRKQAINPQSPIKKDDKIQLVYEIIKKNPNLKLTKQQITDKTGIPRSTLTRILQFLEKSDKIKRQGANKNGYWIVIE